MLVAGQDRRGPGAGAGTSGRAGGWAAVAVVNVVEVRDGARGSSAKSLSQIHTGDGGALSWAPADGQSGGRWS